MRRLVALASAAGAVSSTAAPEASNAELLPMNRFYEGSVELFHMFRTCNESKSQSAHEAELLQEQLGAQMELAKTPEEVKHKALDVSMKQQAVNDAAQRHRKAAVAAREVVAQMLSAVEALREPSDTKPYPLFAAAVLPPEEPVTMPPTTDSAASNASGTTTEAAPVEANETSADHALNCDWLKSVCEPVCGSAKPACMGPWNATNMTYQGPCTEPVDGSCSGESLPCWMPELLRSANSSIYTTTCALSGDGTTVDFTQPCAVTLPALNLPDESIAQCVKLAALPITPEAESCLQGGLDCPDVCKANLTDPSSTVGEFMSVSGEALDLLGSQWRTFKTDFRGATVGMFHMGKSAAFDEGDFIDGGTRKYRLCMETATLNADSGSAEVYSTLAGILEVMIVEPDSLP